MYPKHIVAFGMNGLMSVTEVNNDINFWAYEQNRILRREHRAEDRTWLRNQKSKRNFMR